MLDNELLHVLTTATMKPLIREFLSVAAASRLDSMRTDIILLTMREVDMMELPVLVSFCPYGYQVMSATRNTVR